STSSSSQRSSAAASSRCAVAIAAEASSNFVRSLRYRSGSSRVRCSFAISACSLAIAFGKVSSACFSLKLSRRLGAAEGAENPVMADQDHGAFIVAEHFLEHVKRFEIEIVGRLVQNEKVGGLCQRARQHQSAALAAGEHL